jgi:sialic acid synthase SpsE
VRIFNKDTSKDVIVIAEIGINHGGSVKWILDMLPRIKASGADAVKFQLFTPDLYSSRSNTSRHAQISSFYLSEADFLQIKKACDSLNLAVFATPLSHDWVKFIAATCGVIKIASGDFTFSPTLESALNSSAKLIVSSGATSRDEVKEFVKLAKLLRPGEKYFESIAMLHCISSYPPPISESNLSGIADLREMTELTIGFSSHFLEDAPIYTAIGLGCKIFEIHVTDNRARQDVRDHALSRTPEELRIIISTLNELSESLSSGFKDLQKSEITSLNNLRKGVVYSKKLYAGHTLVKNDFTYARPFNPEVPNFTLAEGRILRKDVEPYFTVLKDDFE